MVLQEVKKIWRAISVQSFQGHGCKFEPYTPFNRKPVELFEKFIWRQWRCTRMLVQDNPSRCMLDTLKMSCVLKRSSIQNRVQLIKARVEWAELDNELRCMRNSFYNSVLLVPETRFYTFSNLLSINLLVTFYSTVKVLIMAYKLGTLVIILRSLLNTLFVY